MVESATNQIVTCIWCLFSVDAKDILVGINDREINTFTGKNEVVDYLKNLNKHDCKIRLVKQNMLRVTMVI